MNWRIEIEPISRVVGDDAPDIILNPFGEVYPEEDFVSSKTMNEIRQFVWNGGVYVNVAGILFGIVTIPDLEIVKHPAGSREFLRGKLSGDHSSRTIFRTLRRRVSRRLWNPFKPKKINPGLEIYHQQAQITLLAGSGLIH